MRILHLSDPHVVFCDSARKKAVRQAVLSQIDELQPDVVAITGDLVASSPDHEYL